MILLFDHQLFEQKLEHYRHFKKELFRMIHYRLKNSFKTKKG